MTDYSAAPLHIRSADAPYYLGMDTDQFDGQVRPLLKEMPTFDGRGGTYFRRQDLDAWADAYKRDQGRRR